MRRIASAAVSVALMITGVFATPASAGSETACDPPDPPCWHVQVGSGGLTGGAFDGRAGNAFYPGTIAVHAGDRIVFTPVSPHTVTFNPPPTFKFVLFAPTHSAGTLDSPTAFVNSGFNPFAPPSPFTLTVDAGLPAGSYKYICLLHVGMSGTVNVLSGELPRTDAEYGAIAQREIARDLATAAKIAAEARENNDDEDGAPTVSVGVGNNRVTNLRFFPSPITIHVGQTVTFLKTHDPTEPHTVSFGPPPPPLVPPELAELFPAGSTTTGNPFTTLVHSGWLQTKKQVDFYAFASSPFPLRPVVARTKFKVTFTAIGEYDYICAIHDDAGMKAKVIVVR